MRLLEFGKEASLASVIEAIKAVPDSDINLKIPEDTPWLKNPVNEKILRKSVQQFGKTVHFEGRNDPVVEPIVAPAEPSYSPPMTPEPEPVSPYTETDEAGFVVGGDVLNRPSPPIPEVTPLIDPVIEKPATADLPFKVSSPPPIATSKNRWKIWGRALIKHWPYSLIGGLVLLLLIAAYVVFALPRADVKIIVAERPLEREATLTASTQTTSIDVNARKIPARVLVSTVSGSSSGNTTGTKAVGTSAQGTVTLYNGTDSDKNFAAGQLISAPSATSSGSLKFSLSQAVTVPKRTGTIITGYKSGQIDVPVAAAAIGSQYNLSANTTFSLDGFDAASFQGQNSAALTGGSSRNVQIATQADLDKLKNDLTTQLTNKAKSDITAKAGSDTQIVDKGITTKVVTSSADHHAGEAANSVNLNLTLSVSATVYSGQDLKKILSQTLDQASPDGYEVDSNTVETSADLANVEKNGDLTFLGHIRANLIPKFDHAQLAQNLVGKRPDVADTYLKAIPSVVSYTVNIWPNLPAAIQSFPRDSKRINIQVTMQQ